jgi:uncharacterized LabA/DUF88 family protein/cold shock CspA family protein
MLKPLQNDGLTRIGVFYDGNYYLHVSNYYNFVHTRRSRLSISGLHHFIRHQVASECGQDVRHCQIVDAHFFRGRLNAQEASQKGNQLYYDRVFDDILMNEGVVTHYLPLKHHHGGGYRHEKGIDVWLALEAYELAFHKQFNVIVLLTSDGDYVPLIRKLNTLGTRVMVLSWDFEFTNDDGQRIVTRTSQDLLEEVTYPVSMHEIIENRLSKNDLIINNLFVPPNPNRFRYQEAGTEGQEGTMDNNGNENLEDDDTPAYLLHGEKESSFIHSLKAGYGFIKYPPNNLFFHFSSLNNAEFTELREGDAVRFTLDRNEKGEVIAKNVELVLASHSSL